MSIKENELKYLLTVKEQYFRGDKKISHISNVYVVYKNIDAQDLVLQKEEVSEVKYVYYKDFEKI